MTHIDFRKTLIAIEKSSFLHSIYYWFIQHPILYRHKKVIKYVVFGLAGTIVDLVLLTTLTEIFNIYYIFSSIFSEIAGITVNFFINKRYTFKYHGANMYQAIHSFVMYLLVSLVCLYLVVQMMFYLVEYLGIYYLIAKFLSLTIISVVRFFGHKKLAFS